MSLVPAQLYSIGQIDGGPTNIALKCICLAPFTFNELHYEMQAGASLLVCRVFAVDAAHNFLHDSALSSSINADLGVRSPTPYEYIHSNMPAQEVLQEAGLPGHAGLQAFLLQR